MLVKKRKSQSEQPAKVIFLQGMVRHRQGEKKEADEGALKRKEGRDGGEKGGKGESQAGKLTR